MLDNIEKIIESKKYPPVLLIFGEEDFLAEEAYAKLIASIIVDESYSYDFESLDATDKEVTLNRIVDSCLPYPFVAERRTVVVRHFENLFSGRTAKAVEENSPFARYLKSPQPSTFLILIANDEKLKGMAAAVKKAPNDSKTLKKISSLKFPYNIILEKYEWLEFPKVYESSYHSWISARVKNYGKTITPEACECIVSQTDQTLRTINNEIGKLISYVQDKKTINEEDVHFIVGVSRVYNVFELQKSIGRRDVSKTLEIIENMMAAERQEMLIMTMLTRYFIALWALLEEAGKTSDNYQLAGKAGISPFFVQEYLSSMRNYSPAELDRAFILLAEADERLKSSSTDAVYILQRMLINIMER